MALSFALRGPRVTEAQPSLRRDTPSYTPDVWALRRDAERAYEAWLMADVDTEEILHAEMVAADARLQLLITDGQRRIGVPVDSAKCGDARAELLRRIGYVREAQEARS